MFSRNDTKAIKGIAILMMLFHHLAGFPDRYAPGFAGFQSLWRSFTDRGMQTYLAYFSHLCVSLFFFLGGYGLYMQWKKKRYHLLDHLKRLYKAYWRVLLLFIPIALIFFRRSDPALPALYHTYDFHDTHTLLVNVLGDLVGHSATLNKEWWFFKAYIAMLMMGLLFCNVTKKNKSFVIDLLIVFLIDYLRAVVVPNMLNTTLFENSNANVYFLNFIQTDYRAVQMYLGIVFAKHNGIVRAKKELKKLRCSWIYGLLAMLLIFYFRSYIAGMFMDLVYLPCFIIAASVFLDGIPPVKKAFIFFGKHSNNMWLTHTFFCYYFYECAKIVYSTRSPLLDFLILLGMSLAASLSVNSFWKMISMLTPKLRNFFLKPQPKETPNA